METLSTTAQGSIVGVQTPTTRDDRPITSEQWEAAVERLERVFLGQRRIPREQAEAAFQKLERLFQEAMVTYREAFGDPYPRSCSGTNRFIADLKDAAAKTQQDIDATEGVFLNAIPVLTMYLLGIEAGFVEHPRGWERTRRAKSIIYGPDLPSRNQNAGRCSREGDMPSTVDSSSQ